MRLIHRDGRTWTVPAAGYERHRATYDRAGWRIARTQDEGADVPEEAGGVRIRSRHNEERTVSEDEFAATYEAAGWTKVDDAPKGTAKTAKKGA